MSTINALSGASLAIQLAAIEEDHHDAENDANKNLVAIDTNEHKFQRERQFEAEQRAAEEARESSFWDDVGGIAKDVAVVGSVAAAAFTGGSSLIVAATLIGGAATVGSDVARRLGADDKLCTGLEIGGAALSLGAGAGGAIFDVAPAAVSQTSATVGLIDKGVEAGATLVQGGASYKEKAAQSDETNYQADAKTASDAVKDAQTRIDDSISAMQRSLQDRNRKFQTIANLQSSDERLTNTLLNNMRG
jgi:hypothetical protein